ncbi:MAG TPA: UDP-3-O-(3-hydroxymyristoyl)glucosamine N-acyltransferase [Terriglobales bacterium]|jgi:UDP-3-O-[3-hydroxymyristoyl] glucosamine N-acyltransferase|nr:UDP-3-O-(3-hydroxymyristoyl)glucosamine N-acyltransferase [Terriglobales bacterium]
MKHSLEKLAEAAGAQLLGNGKIEISGIASLESATENDLVFAEAEDDLRAALESPAAAVVAGEFARGMHARKPLLIARQPRLAFARAGKVIFPPRRREPGIASTAFVHDSVKMGKLVSVEPGCYIGEGAVIGDRTRIGVGGFIAPRVTVGDDCSLKARVTVYSDTTIGNRVVVAAGAVLGSDGFGFVRDETTGVYEKFPQVGRLEIADDVEIGANVTIDRGALDATVIGRGTKIDNQVHIGHNVRIGKNVVIAAQTGISGSAVIEDNVLIAGQVGLADHVRIGEGAILGAQCGVPTKKVIRGRGIVFWGTPARPIREYLKQLAVLARLGKKERLS